jgi:hypothetical protein
MQHAAAIDRDPLLLLLLLRTGTWPPPVQCSAVQ